MSAIVDISAIRSAQEHLAAHTVLTPLLEYEVLNDLVGRRVLLKAENLQRVGAFKFRGAFNRIRAVDPRRFPGGVVACSSGNHAQGVAAAATLLGHRSVIVMPSDAPAVKVERTKRFGGDVVLYDRSTEDRDAIAAALGEERRADFVSPFDDPLVIAGQGTVGLEIAEQCDEAGIVPDAVLVPCSGGGLAGGIAVAVHDWNPGVSVHTVEPEGFDDFARSLVAGERLANAARSGSVCDALLVDRPGKLTFEIARNEMSDGLVVADEAALRAVRFAFDELKLVVEPGGAAGLAAVLEGQVPASSGAVVAVLSGGNVDPALFARIVTGA